MRIDRSQFSFNTQEVYYSSGGGAIYAQQSNITVDSSVFDNNNGGYGGAIYFSSESFQIANTTFLKNRAGGSQGGAIRATHAFSNSSVSQCQFINNVASGKGGTVYMLLYTSDTTTIAVMIAQCQFRNNSSRGQGGALYMYLPVSYRTNKVIT